MADEVRRAKIVKADDDERPAREPRRKSKWTLPMIVAGVALSLAVFAVGVVFTAYRVKTIYQEVKQEKKEAEVVAVKSNDAWLGMKAKTAAEVLAFAGPPSSSNVVALSHKGPMKWTYRMRVYNEVTQKNDTTAVLHFNDDGYVYQVLFTN